MTPAKRNTDIYTDAAQAEMARAGTLEMVARSLRCEGDIEEAERVEAEAAAGRSAANQLRELAREAKLQEARGGH